MIRFLRPQRTYDRNRDLQNFSQISSDANSRTRANRMRPASRAVLLAALGLLLVAGPSGLVSYGDGASVNVPDRIRVALFLNLGAGKFQALSSSATLQSSGGLNIVWRDPGSALPVAAVTPAASVKFAVDGYKALVLETADFAAATATLKKLQAGSSAAFITKLTKKGAPVYQVTEGVYSTAAAAATALTKWTKAGVANDAASLSAARVAGPWAVEAGPYASADEAAAAAERFGAAGLDAFAAIKLDNGVLTNVVRIGQESDGSKLPALQQSAAAAGANAVVPAANGKYAVIRTDVTTGNSPAQQATLYAVPLSAGVTLRADPAGNAPIQIAEKAKRSYRGSFEISAYNQTIAVINDIDLEQYLYSVVGAEVGSSWPAEAQKAQAVAARSYAVAAGMGFQIANVVDTTLSQAYNGTSSENANSTTGVEATKGEVVVAGSRVLNAIFSSNAGGVTADSKTEVWGNDAPNLASVATSPDEGPNAGKLNWYRIGLPSGQTGFVREDLLADEGLKNEAGMKMLRVKSEGATVRVRPLIDTAVTPIGRLSVDSLVVYLEKVPEYSVYSWVEAPMKPDKLAPLAAKAGVTGPVKSVEVSGKGPSGRVVEVTVNGKPYKPASPDGFRSAFGGVKSTLFDVEETGRYAVLDGSGNVTDVVSKSSPLVVIGEDGETADADGPLFVMDASGRVRVVTPDPTFIVSGKGYGHGLGMSQWGARGLAEKGYDYKAILQYYYKNVSIEKDAAP